MLRTFMHGLRLLDVLLRKARCFLTLDDFEYLCAFQTLFPLALERGSSKSSLGNMNMNSPSLEILLEALPMTTEPIVAFEVVTIL
jgi:hypothetical protein